MQVVATKPIARWQIWLGKWLGIMSLNAALLALSGACVYGLLQWRAAKLPAAEQTVLREQVLVARGSAREQNFDAEIDAETERILQDRLKNSPVEKADVPVVRKQIREQVKADFQLVPPGYTRQWQIDLGFAKNYPARQAAATAREIQLGAEKSRPAPSPPCGRSACRIRPGSGAASR